MGELNTPRILLTGAASGIGRETASLLAARPVGLTLVDRDAAGLDQLATSLGRPVDPIACDLADAAARDRLCEALTDDPPDILINNAGTLNFSPLEALPEEAVETEFRVNVLAPIVLSRAVLSGMRHRRSGTIVNVGSIFGSIGFAYFTTYSATKFAMRGFSEALRRELHGSGISVCYVAPRATRTKLATQFGRMAEHVGMRMDDPSKVAQAIVTAMDSRRPETYVGFPESFFVRVNALLPRWVDRALRRQNDETRPFARSAIVERFGLEAE